LKTPKKPENKPAPLNLFPAFFPLIGFCGYVSLKRSGFFDEARRPVNLSQFLCGPLPHHCAFHAERAGVWGPPSDLLFARSFASLCNLPARPWEGFGLFPPPLKTENIFNLTGFVYQQVFASFPYPLPRGHFFRLSFVVASLFRMLTAPLLALGWVRAFPPPPFRFLFPDFAFL